LTLRSLVSPGKSSPVIRRGLFLTGDQSHDGGKGGAVKNSTPKGCFNCAAQLRFACLRHGGFLFHPRGVFYLCRPTQLRFVAAREAGGFRCAPEERGITAYGLAHRLWIHPRFCALQERGSRQTIPPSPARLQRANGIVYHFDLWASP